MLYYLLVYALLTLGAFAVLTVLSGKGKEIGVLSELDGLASSHPFLAAALSIFLISLAGIPPSAGFLAKYFLFAQAIQLGLYPLAVVGILASVVSLYYYLGPVVRMYFHPAQQAQDIPHPGFWFKGLLVLMILGVFYLGLLPSAPFRSASQTNIQGATAVPLEASAP
jgi:NADH-quinone oxidoreductase subunit N